MPVGIRKPFSAGVVSLCVLVGGLVFASAPALAAAPEAPVTGEANPVTTTTATLNGELGELNPEDALEVGTYEFLYRESATTCEGWKTVPVPAGGALSKEPVSQSLSGLSPGTRYTFCLLARNAAGETALGAPVTLTTHGAGITEEQVSTVEASAATLQADIDPGGGETRYRFEYDTAPYTSSAPHGISITKEGENTEVNIGAETSPVPVSARLNGLQPGKVYYYRVVASNEAGTFDGPGKAFTTNPEPVSEPPQSCPNEQRRSGQPFGLKLPDCRAYEMVSPTDTNGQDATVSNAEWGPRVAVSGEAITYASRGLFGQPTGGDAENQLLSNRAANGWVTKPVTPLHDPLTTEQLPPFEGDAFTPELTEGITNTNASLVAGAPGGENEDEFGTYIENFQTGTYQYLDPGKYVYGASSDLSRVMLENSEWINGTIVPVMVTNEGETIEGTVGEINPNPSYRQTKDLWHGVSADGSRVYFTSPRDQTQPAVARLFVRVNVGQPQSPIAAPEASGTGNLMSGSHTVSALVSTSGIFGVGQSISGDGVPAGTTVTAVGAGSLTLSNAAVSSGVGVALDAGGGCTVAGDACTIDVSASQRLLENPAGVQPARYWGASADGSRVFFSSKAELTEDAYTGPSGNAPNLYEYELSGEPGQRGKLTDLTVDESGDGAGVLGVVQISEDGSYVYFVAEGALAAGAVAGQRNLYVWHEGTVAFIASLAADDVSDWENGLLEPPNEAGPTINTAVVDPSGTRLAFMSGASLTGDANEQAQHGDCELKIEGGLCNEVFLYDAQSGGLVCASCNPTGARPVGPSRFGQLQQSNGLYRPRNLLDDGALFFDGSDALVPHASDGRQNVYEYEDGHVYAISNVAGGQESFFMDASASGNDVFFASSDQLLPEDTSENVVVWDARVDGGFPVTVSPSVCDNADSCKPPVSPQPAAFGAPASATFAGPGNTTPTAVSPASKPLTKKAVKCKRGKKLDHGKCVKPKQRKRSKAKSSSDRKGGK